MSTGSPNEEDGDDRFTTTKILFKENKFSTITYILMFGLVGMSSTYLGPLLETMRCQVHATEKFMTVVFACQLFSMLLGTLIAGLLNKVIGADLLLSISGIVLVISTMLLGFSHSLNSFLPILAINGLSSGFIDNLCNMQMINLFGEKVGPFMQAMHFVFALSAFVILLISGPFISLGYRSCNELDRIMNGTGMSVITPLYGIISVLEVPAVICAIVLTAFGSWRCVGYRHKDECVIPMSKAKKESYTELSEDDSEVSSNFGNMKNYCVFNDKPEVSKSFALGFLILVIAICMTVLADGIQGEYNGYIFEYSIKVLKDSHSKDMAGYLTCSFWAFFALGRLLSVIISTKLQTCQMLVIAMVGLTVSSLPLIIVSNHIVPLFIETSLFGLFLSNAIPGIFTLAEETIDLTRCKVTALVMGSALGEACMPLIVGALVNNVMPMAFPLFNFVVVMIVFVLFILLIYFGTVSSKKLAIMMPILSKKDTK